MNTKVVPDPSERCTTAIAWDGSFTFGLSLRIAASFHDLISPRKILAKVEPSRTRSPGLTPSMLTTGTTPAVSIGNCKRPSLSRSATLSGMSEAAKVTSLFWICVMPSLEPIA